MNGQREARQLARQLERLGWEVALTGGNHWRVRHPVTKEPVFFGFSPSDYRWRKNTLREIRRIQRSLGETPIG